MASSLLSPTQRYAAGTLYAIAVHQAQIHQSIPLGLHFDEYDHQRISNGSNSSNDSVAEDPHLWVHPNSGLLRPIFQLIALFFFKKKSQLIMMLGLLTIQIN